MQKRGTYFVVVFLSYFIVIGFLCFYATGQVIHAGTRDFTDVPGSHWARQAIGAMQERAIVQGFPDHRFYPEKKVTYGEFIKMALLLQGRDAVGNSSQGNWAAGYYREGLAQGLYTGFSIPEAKLSWPIPRQDMALIMDGLIPEASRKVEDFQQEAAGISDVNRETANQYQIVRAYALDLLKGYPDGTFRPEETLNRGEAAQVVYRLMQLRERESIRSLAGNLEDFRKDSWIDTEKFRLLTPQEANLSVRVPFNGNLASFDHTMVGFIYLVEDGRIVEYSRSIPAETFVTSGSHLELEKIDYVICIPTRYGNQESILVVADPFRGQV